MTTSGELDINGWPIWYEKVGYGPHPLLLIPGAIGTGKTDFRDQLEGEYALDYEKFTIIAVECLRWGRSRPPKIPYGTEIYNIDAECCLKLMQGLGYEQFSVLGWSDGARVALLMSCIYPNCIKSAILLTIPVLMTENFQKILLSSKNVKNWRKEKVDYYLISYKDIQEIQDLWNRLVDNYAKYFNEDLYNDIYHRIKCPVLIIHGDKDRLVEIQQSRHVFNNIKSAKLHRFPSGAHNLHQVLKLEFKTLVEQFLYN